MPQQLVRTTTAASWHFDPALIPVAIVGILAALAIVVVNTVLRARERARRLELIEAALRNRSLLPETQRQLIEPLKPQPSRRLFVVGWLGAFAGVGMLCLGLEGFALWLAVNITALSFALITLPLALREVEARRS